MKNFSYSLRQGHSSKEFPPWGLLPCPRKEAGQKDRTLLQCLHSGSHSMNILIVDDSSDGRKDLRYIAEQHDHQVLEAKDGREGLVMGLLITRT